MACNTVNPCVCVRISSLQAINIEREKKRKKSLFINLYLSQENICFSLTFNGFKIFYFLSSLSLSLSLSLPAVYLIHLICRVLYSNCRNLSLCLFLSLLFSFTLFAESCTATAEISLPVSFSPCCFHSPYLPSPVQQQQQKYFNDISTR